MAQGAASEAAGGGRQERVQRGSRKHKGSCRETGGAYTDAEVL